MSGCIADWPLARPKEPLAVHGATVAGFSSPDLIYLYLANGVHLAILGRFGDAGFTVDDIIAAHDPDNPLGGSTDGIHNGQAMGTGIYYTLDARIEEGRVAGSIARNGTSWSFSGSSIQHSDYRWSEPATFAAVTGAWWLRSVYGDVQRIDIDDAGTISGTYHGCALTGAAEPSSHYNYFKVTINVSGSCGAAAPVPISGFLLNFRSDSGHDQLLLYGSARWPEDWGGAFLFASGAR